MKAFFHRTNGMRNDLYLSSSVAILFDLLKYLLKKVHGAPSHPQFICFIFVMVKFLHNPQCIHDDCVEHMTLWTVIQMNVFHNLNPRHKASKNLASCIFCIIYKCRSQPEVAGYLKHKGNKMATHEPNTVIRKSDFSLFLL